MQLIKLIALTATAAELAYSQEVSVNVTFPDSYKKVKREASVSAFNATAKYPLNTTIANVSRRSPAPRNSGKETYSLRVHARGVDDDDEDEDEDEDDSGETSHSDDDEGVPVNDDSTSSQYTDWETTLVVSFVSNEDYATAVL